MRRLLAAVIALQIGFVVGLLGGWPLTAAESAARPSNPSDFSHGVDGPISYVLEPNITVFTDGYNKKLPGYIVRTNDRGLREEPFQAVPPENTTRVLVLGDSYTFGWGVNRSDRFTDRAEQRLNAAGANVQVLNAGIPGYGMQDFSLFLEHRGVSYNPDIVVVAFSFEDIVAVADNDRFRVEAERTIPENVGDRNYKVNQERIRLKTAFFEKHEQNHSLLLKEMQRIANIAPADTALMFYYIKGQDLNGAARQQYIETAERLNATALFSPPKFDGRPRDRYTLPNDGHYNAVGHHWLAERLAAALQNSVLASAS